jgi:hypothetical protein
MPEETKRPGILPIPMGRLPAELGKGEGVEMGSFLESSLGGVPGGRGGVVAIGEDSVSLGGVNGLIV